MAYTKDLHCNSHGCAKPPKARGWCSAHYQRWQRHDDPLGGRPEQPQGRTVEERFWAKVDKGGECWIWTGATDRNGYGAFKDAGRTVKAHRYAYELLVGLIPPGLTPDHLCRVRACVNPAHLEPVTGKENTLRGVGFSAINARKTHCDSGHEYTPENTYVDPNGWRECRTCIRERQRIRRAAQRKKAA